MATEERKEYLRKYYSEWRKTDKGKEIMRLARIRHREKKGKPDHRRRNLKWMYGVTPEWYDQTLADQGGGCAICGRPPPPEKNLHIDHCHKTGTVRGILCTLCNTALGKFQDSPDILNKAIEYLKRKYN